jgi:hypothetical protein
MRRRRFPGLHVVHWRGVISCVGLRKFKESALLVVIKVHAPHRAPLHDRKISVCGLYFPGEENHWSDFFPSNNRLERYTNDILFARSAQSDEGEINDYFQQDGTSAHRVRNSMKLLRKFLKTVTFKGGLAPWPPCLAPPLFFSGEP